MYPVGGAAYVSRAKSFRKLEEKIQDSSRRRSVRTRFDQQIMTAEAKGQFTTHFEQPVVPNALADEEEAILQDIFTYFRQQGYYVESRAIYNKYTQLIKDGIFIAWDRALPSQSMMIPK